MLKFGAQNGDRRLVGVGLSEGNINKLRQGLPILFPLEEMKVPGADLFLFAGETEQEMMKQLDFAITGTTEIKDSSQEKVLILTVGLPYSGKSTWARKQGVPVVCPDEIRIALHGRRFIASAEPFVWAIAHVMVDALFRAGHGVVILDACNNSQKRRDEWLSNQWSLKFQEFNTAPEECKARATAAGDEAIISVIDRMAQEREPLPA